MANPGGGETIGKTIVSFVLTLTTIYCGGGGVGTIDIKTYKSLPFTTKASPTATETIGIKGTGIYFVLLVVESKANNALFKLVEAVAKSRITTPGTPNAVPARDANWSESASDVSASTNF